MLLISNVLVLFLMIRTTGTSRATIMNRISISDEETSYMEGALANILTLCYETVGSTTPEIVVAGSWPDTFLPTLWSRKLIPVSLFDERSAINYVKVGTYGIRKQRIFVMSVDSHVHLRNVYRRLLSESFNPVGSYVIVLRSPVMKYRCFRVNYYFLMSWIFHIVNAKVLCTDRSEGSLLIHAYNPLGSVAPAPWRKDIVIPDIFQGLYPLTIFVRSYRADEEICVEWNLDLTKNMTDFVFPVEEQIFPANKHIGKGINSNAYLEINKHIFDTMYRSWKVKPMTFSVEFPRSFELHRFNDSLPPIMPLLSTDPGPIRMGIKAEACSAPFSRTGLVFVTNFRGHKSQLEKILFVIDKESRIGLCVVLLLTLVFFKFVVGQAAASAFLNVVRIVCNTGFEGLSVNTPTRIYVTALLLFAVTMQGIYQGDLASLLTHNIPVKNVDTVKDLAESGYTIYGHVFYHRIFTDPIFEDRFIPVPEEDCIEYVIEDSTAACVNRPHVLMDQAATLKLHLSVEYVIERDEVMRIFPYFPMRDKLDWMLRSMVEGDIIKPLHLRVQLNTLDDFRFDEAVMNNQHHKVLNLKELAFAFALLAIGLSCALVTFVGEIAIFRYRSRISRSRVRILNFRAWRSV